MPTTATSASGSGSSAASSPSTAGTTGSNVAAITLDAGPVGATGIVNTPYVSVKVCVPGTSSCQTIDHVILDTGSSGLRLLASAVSNLASLPQQTDASNNPVAECAQFVSSYSWGSVRLADVTLAGETAASVPLQIIADPAFPIVPATCSNAGAANDSVASLGSNGLLGVGSFLQDCGGACASTAIPGTYYTCPGGRGCTPTALALAKQVAHPVAMLPSDNNGVLIQLPAIDPGGATNVAGMLVLGIGTRANNALGAAQVYGVDSGGDFTTVFNGNTYANSFIDSGSNFLFFNSSALPTCTSAGWTGFYCPASTQTFTAVNQGTNGTNGSVGFSVGNARSLFTNNNAATAFNDVAGTSPGGDGFDWGLPFFFGRNVFTAIEGASTPADRGPYVAY
ncbi:DUF3443 domain-containing protein [Variovorax sp. HW608]|uniref:DUF3443 domain-containing protein n=1 Tax=Variovorax sp. HW608 TaxID=1034889 RepID=UPI001E40FCCA|nr:DUF3443 domain-containing protein [Variovorax sp. HW608]